MIHYRLDDAERLHRQLLENVPDSDGRRVVDTVFRVYAQQAGRSTIGTPRDFEDVFTARVLAQSLLKRFEELIAARPSEYGTQVADFLGQMVADFRGLEHEFADHLEVPFNDDREVFDAHIEAIVTAPAQN